MKYALITLVATAALITVAPASSQLMTHPKCPRLHCREVSQKQNLQHAKFLCSYGRKETKRWGCQAVRWLGRELKETIAALRPNDISAWLCIHRYEGAWNANTGNGYYGGLQMDRQFQSLYGPDFVKRWGTADNWPAWAQLIAARRARDSGRGYYPWPNTARRCGLI